jgi:hypothetical protein
MTVRQRSFVLGLSVAFVVTGPLGATQPSFASSPHSFAGGVVGLPAWDLARVPPASASALNAVRTVGDSETWAVGTVGGATLTERWNGHAFTAVKSPSRAGRANDLTGVDGASPSDVWAVGHADGGDGLGSSSLIEHWDGQAWKIDNSPSTRPANTRNDLTGVAALTATDSWAVGAEERPRGRPGPIVLHWTGKEWTRSANACAGGLNGVEALSADDIWAVGGTQTCHYDGTRWKDLPAAPSSYPAHVVDLLGVATIAPADLWAVGYESWNCGESVCYGGVVEHWNGSAWTYASTGADVLSGVDAVSATNVYAVGAGPTGPAILHYDGTSWLEIPNVTATADLRSIALNEHRDLAVGVQPYDDSVAFAEQAPSPTSGAVVGDTNVAYATVSWFGRTSGSVTTNAFGSYQVAALRAGMYRFTETSAGCQPEQVKVIIRAGTTIEQDLHLDCPS